jgi:hypothetical protein
MGKRILRACSFLSRHHSGTALRPEGCACVLYCDTLSEDRVCWGLSALFLTGTRLEARAGSVCCGSRAVCEWTSSDRRDIYCRDFDGDGEVSHIHCMRTNLHVMARLFCLRDTKNHASKQRYIGLHWTRILDAHKPIDGLDQYHGVIDTRPRKRVIYHPSRLILGVQS